MAEIKQQFIQVKTKANFVTKLTNGEIKDSSIAFIEDSSEIWTKGKYYPCPYTKESLDNKFNEYIPLLQKGQANGVATLDANGKIPVAQMPENGELSASLYKIVDTLPTTGIDTSKIYLVPASATTAKNNKTEYIYLGDPNKAYDESKWEKLGDEQKSSTVTTPGGSITVDTALIENSPNPVAGGVVKAKFDEVDTKLAKKVESSDYTTKMTAIDSKLKTLENKTIDVDAELKDSTNPVQNRAVNKAVNDLNDVISKKADTTALNSAVDRITALENNGATEVTVTESGEGNGIASIKNVGKNIVATKATFVTSLTGYVTTDTLNTELAKKSDVGHTHTQYAETSALDNYALKSALDRKVDAVVGKGLSTEDFTSAEKTKLGGIAEGATRVIVDDTINDSINAVQNSAVKKAVDDLNTAIGKKANSTDLNAATGKITTLETNAATILSVTGEGNGISGISKSGNTITATKGNFLTSAAGLATKNDILPDTLASKGIATKTWVNEQGFATGTIPTKTSQLNNDSGFLVDTVEKAHFNELYMEESPESNGVAYIWIDNTNKKELCVRRAKFVKPENLETAIDDYASKKGYLTENNLNEKLKETVTIKLVSDKSASDTNLNGTTVTVKSGDTTVSTHTWQGTPINVKVPCDKDVTIEAATVKMYMKPQVLKYVPSPLYNREVVFTYKALELGVFIIDTNNNLINKDSWSPTMRKTAVGVALITEKVAIVISAGLQTGLCWSTASQLVGGVTTTTDYNVAVTDYKGKANTEAIVKALGQNAPAAYYCSNYTFKNGKKGYLMAVGESMEIFVNMQKISELLDYINLDTNNLVNGHSVWTSTQNDGIAAWYTDGIRLRRLSKIVDDNYIVPIYSLYD